MQKTHRELEEKRCKDDNQNILIFALILIIVAVIFAYIDAVK